MKLHKFHVDQFRAGFISERMSIARVLPAVARDLVRATDSAGRKHDCLGFENFKTATLALVTKRADRAVAVFEDGQDCVFHEHVDTLMDAVVLKRADHFRARCGHRRAPAADIGDRRNFSAGFARLACDRKPHPTLRVRARDQALLSRAIQPCANC